MNKINFKTKLGNHKYFSHFLLQIDIWTYNSLFFYTFFSIFIHFSHFSSSFHSPPLLSSHSCLRCAAPEDLAVASLSPLAHVLAAEQTPCWGYLSLAAGKTVQWQNTSLRIACLLLKMLRRSESWFLQGRIYTVSAPAARAGKEPAEVVAVQTGGVQQQQQRPTTAGYFSKYF